MKQYNVKLSYSRMTYIFSILVLYASLNLSYYYVISRYFAYEGYTLNPNILKLIESIFLTILIVIIVPFRIKKPSDFLINLFFLIPILPTLSLYWLRNDFRAYTYMVIVSFIIINIVRAAPKVKFSQLRCGKCFSIAISFVVVIVVLTFMLYRGGLSYFNLNLIRVYQFRRKVGAVIDTRLFSYINHWAYKVFNPVLISWSLYRRRYGLFVVFTGLQIVFFGISSHKSVLFYPFIIVAVFILLRRSNKMHAFPLSLSGVIITTSLIAIVFEQFFPVSLLVRRALFVPARLNYAYYSFFSNEGFVYLSTAKVFRLFIDYPFAYPPPQMISLYLTGDANTWMSNGFLATSYMHFGFCGMVIFSFIVGLLLNIVDNLSKDRVPCWFSISLVVVPFFILFSGSDLTTTLLNHGLGLAIVMLWLLST